MENAVAATFCCIDWKKNKLMLAPAAVPFNGDQNAGWSLTIDQNSGVFAFLKKNMANKVYMAVAYAMKA